MRKRDRRQKVYIEGLSMQRVQKIDKTINEFDGVSSLIKFFISHLNIKDASVENKHNLMSEIRFFIEQSNNSDLGEFLFKSKKIDKKLSSDRIREDIDFFNNFLCREIDHLIYGALKQIINGEQIAWFPLTIKVINKDK